MRLSATGFTLPWQAVAAHEPGPMYFASGAWELCAFAAEANPAQATNSTSANGRMRRAVNCIAAKGEILRMNALQRASLLSLEEPRVNDHETPCAQLERR